MQLTLVEQETARGIPSGCAAWLSFGLKIEEQQSVQGSVLLVTLRPIDAIDLESNCKGLFENLAVTPQPSRKFSWSKRDPDCVRK